VQCAASLVDACPTPLADAAGEAIPEPQDVPGVGITHLEPRRYEKTNRMKHLLSFQLTCFDSAVHLICSGDQVRRTQGGSNMSKKVTRKSKGEQGEGNQAPASRDKAKPITQSTRFTPRQMEEIEKACSIRGWSISQMMQVGVATP
jgi:hypothetical protein